jgi:hypothetical protein
MFEICNQLYPAYAEKAEEDRHNDNAHATQQIEGTNQKVFLPAGSAQSRFAPASYYYLASKSGVTPSWVIDQLYRTRRLNVNS